jgi:mannose-6-phosphate isomerase-like protein (cupin superfamily)
MKFYRIENVGQRGWFIGDYPEAVVSSKEFEICYTSIEEGYIQSHYHTKCREIVLITSGIAIINGREIREGDIVVIEKGEVNDIYAKTKITVVGVKVPAGGQDKVLL